MSFLPAASAIYDEFMQSVRDMQKSEIGSLGPIVFEVSSQKIRTFKGLKRATKARYGSHEVIGSKPVLEFIGPDIEEISFTMQFSAAWGLNPQDETKKVREICEKGEANYFVLNNQTVGENPWIIESVSESVDVVDNNGRVVTTQIDVTLKEYIPVINKEDKEGEEGGGSE